jgi:enoyl-CoA hydratase
MTYESLDVLVADHVAEVSLKGPGKGNALGPAFWLEMPRVMASLEEDANVRVVVVRGAGAHFSFGLDLVGMAAELGPVVTGPAPLVERTRLLGLVRRMQEAVSAVERCPKPVIAAVHGWCIGGALDLVAAADVRLCSADARFSLREVKLAMVADLGSLQRLPRIMGQGATRELAFTGKDIDAAQALRWGLVSQVTDSVDALLVAARAMAQEVAANPPLVVQGIKRVMNDTASMSVADGLRHVALWNAAFLPSDDVKEALTAFAQKRAPRFTGS